MYVAYNLFLDIGNTRRPNSIPSQSSAFGEDEEQHAFFWEINVESIIWM